MDILQSGLSSKLPSHEPNYKGQQSDDIFERFVDLRPGKDFGFLVVVELVLYHVACRIVPADKRVEGRITCLFQT